jgi:hypothetical protein
MTIYEGMMGVLDFRWALEFKEGMERGGGFWVEVVPGANFEAEEVFMGFLEGILMMDIVKE